MDRVLRNSKNSSILACGNTHESVSMKALFEFDNLFSLTSYFTNGIEGFCCHFRRMIDGCYHNVSDEHLQAYIYEACYRWNTRKTSQSERFCDMFNKSIGLVVKHYELKLFFERKHRLSNSLYIEFDFLMICLSVRIISRALYL